MIVVILIGIILIFIILMVREGKRRVSLKVNEAIHTILSRLDNGEHKPIVDLDVDYNSASHFLSDMPEYKEIYENDFYRTEFVSNGFKFTLVSLYNSPYSSLSVHDLTF